MPDSGEPDPTSTDIQVASFLIRFVYEAAADGQPTQGWHGVVRHVQSNAERHFTRWEDAVAFVSAYVELGRPGA